MGKVSPEQIKSFKKEIFSYYKKNKRKFPWREDFRPYSIVVSEIMLQQTQTHRVVPKFLLFLKQFPNFQALAKASVGEVLKEWQGLGYNRRALGLKKIAEIVISEYGGELPKSHETLIEFPSIGEATASSIATFAWNLRRPFIETNIRRVFIHFFFPGKSKVDDKDLMPLIEEITPHKNTREWYYALMDYGAMLKTRVPNPNRKSTGYRVQSKFEGSNRQVRGKILKCLLEKNPCSQSELFLRVPSDKEKIIRNIEALIKEGFIIKKSENIFLAK